jgi:hypothetical protein
MLGASPEYNTKYHTLHGHAVRAMDRLTRISNTEVCNADGTPIAVNHPVTINDRVGGLLGDPGIKIDNANTAYAIERGMAKLQDTPKDGDAPEVNHLFPNPVVSGGVLHERTN